VQLKDEGVLEENCQHRPVQYLNNVLEQDHRTIKRRVKASQHFLSFWAAWRTIAGYEAIHMIRKGRRAGVRRAPGPICCTALLLVCLELKPNSYDYRTQLPSIP
jgi:transposase-like protein